MSNIHHSWHVCRSILAVPTVETVWQMCPRVADSNNSSFLFCLTLPLPLTSHAIQLSRLSNFEAPCLHLLSSLSCRKQYIPACHSVFEVPCLHVTVPFPACYSCIKVPCLWLCISGPITLRFLSCIQLNYLPFSQPLKFPSTCNYTS